MPRRRPSRLRAAAFARHWPCLVTDHLRGLSPQVVAEIARLESARGFSPGMTATALRLWGSFVRDPYRRLWVDNDGGCGIWECCGDPREARDLLESVARGMSRRRAVEFRRRIDPLDDLY